MKSKKFAWFGGVSFLVVSWPSYDVMMRFSSQLSSAANERERNDAHDLNPQIATPKYSWKNRQIQYRDTSFQFLTAIKIHQVLGQETGVVFSPSLFTPP